jgi:UDP-N-acetylglucosamine acyltransferase
MIKSNNFIHPTAIVEPGCVLGKNNYIGPFCYLSCNVTLGDDNRLEGYCSIGTPAEHKNYFTSVSGSVVIGNKNIIREFVTINAGTIRRTILGDSNMILRGSYVGHDSILEDNITLSCNSMLGGHSYIMKGVNFGLGSMCHQYSVIGAYSMLGMGAVVTKKSKICCGEIYVGAPAKLLKVNEVGLSRNNISIDELKKLQEKQDFLMNKK